MVWTPSSFQNFEQWRQAYEMWAVAAVATGQISEKFIHSYLKTIERCEERERTKQGSCRVVANAWWFDEARRKNWAERAERGVLFLEDLEREAGTVNERIKEDSFRLRKDLTEKMVKSVGAPPGLVLGDDDADVRKAHEQRRLTTLKERKKSNVKRQGQLHEIVEIFSRTGVRPMKLQSGELISNTLVKEALVIAATLDKKDGRNQYWQGTSWWSGDAIPKRERSRSHHTGGHFTGGHKWKEVKQW